MPFEDYQDPIIYRKRKGSTDDPYVPFTQTDKVRNGVILLKEIPNKFKGLTIKIGTTALSYKDNGVPDTNTVIVDWTNGILHFHTTNEGKTYEISGFGEGNVFLPSSKVYLNTDTDGNVTDTLKTLSDEMMANRDLVADTDQQIQNAENIRVSNENTRKTNETTRQNAESTRANNETTRIENENARKTAETARQTAESKRQTDSTTAVTNANSAATYATTQGNYAKQEADRLVGTDVSVLDNKIGDLAGLQTIEKGSLVGAVNEHTTQLADIAINIKRYGATADGIANDSEALYQACLTGKNVLVPQGAYNFSLTPEHVQTVLSSLSKIITYSIITIKLPSGVHSFTSSEISRIGSSCSNIKIQGADTVNTTLSGVTSVAGSVGNYDVTFQLTDASGIVVGDVLQIKDIAPAKVYSASSETRRPYANELAVGFYKMGEITTVTGGNTATLSTGNQNTHLSVGDLVHVKGQTRVITAIDAAPAKTFTVNAPWDLGVTGYQWWYYSVPNSGTCGTGGVSSTTITGVGTSFYSQANAGDLILVNGEFRKIVSIASNTNMTVSHGISIADGANFSFMNSGILHEGSFPVTAVSGNMVTIKNRSRYAKPPKNGISTGTVVAIKSVLKNSGTGHGLVFERGGVLNEIKNIALQGNASSTSSVGIALNGNDAGYSPANGRAVIVDPCAFIEWGVGARLTTGCVLHANKGHFCNNFLTGVDCSDGANAYLRDAVISHNNGVGLFLGGGYARISTAKFCGNAQQGIRQDVGSSAYGDMPLAWGNGSHGIMLVNFCGIQFVDGYSIANGLQGANFQNTAGGRISRTLFAGNANHQLSVTNGKLEATQCWFSGGTSGMNGVSASRSELDLLNTAVTGNDNYGVLANTLARVYADDIYVGNNGSYGLRADSYGFILALRNFNNDFTFAGTGGTIVTQ